MSQRIRNALRVTDVARDHDVIDVVQRSARRVERCAIQVDTDHRERIAIEGSTARRLVAHGLVNTLQERAVAAAHVCDIARLRRKRLATEDRDEYFLHFREIAVVHVPAREHVHRAVNVVLVPVRPQRKNRRRIAEQQVVERSEHRSVRLRDAEIHRPIEHELTGRRQAPRASGTLEPPEELEQLDDFVANPVRKIAEVPRGLLTEDLPLRELSQYGDHEQTIQIVGDQGIVDTPALLHACKPRTQQGPVAATEVRVHVGFE
jgi:hypothetical protein